MRADQRSSFQPLARGSDRGARRLFFRVRTLAVAAHRVMLLDITFRASRDGVSTVTYNANDGQYS
jgi:hypothetical protein